MSTEIKQQPNTLALGTFVHTAKEMEVSVYTLRELAKDCRKKAAEAPVGPRNEIARLAPQEAELQKQITLLRIVTENDGSPTPEKKGKITFSDRLGVLFKSWGIIGGFFSIWLLLVATFAIFSVLTWILMGESKAYIALPMGIVCTFLILWPISGKMFRTREKDEANAQLVRYRKQLQADQRELSVREQQLRQCKNGLSNAKEQLRRAEWKAVGLLEEAEELEARADQINSILQSCYVSTNVIGPDYRHIDCMVVFDHVFRNDLADNVRQAVAYYEEKKYRDMVLRGIDNVFQMLGKMAEVMLDVRQILVGISGDVERMSYDMNELLDNQSRMAQTQKAVLQESKASRYAAQQHYAAQQAHNDYVRNQIHWNS